MEKAEKDRYMITVTKNITILNTVTALLNTLVSNGFYVEFYYDSQTIAYGAAVKCGVVVGDLSKPRGERAILKANPGEWSLAKCAKELAVACNVDLNDTYEIVTKKKG